MNVILGVFVLSVFCLAAYFVASAVNTNSIIDKIFIGWLWAVIFVLLTGYSLSSFQAIQILWAWLIGGLFWLFVALHPFAKYKTYIGASKVIVADETISKFSLLDRFYGLRRDLARARPVMRNTICLLGITVILCLLVNFYVAVTVAPGNWDGMTYHLARVGYYLQFGSYSFYEANNWIQVLNFKNSAVLQSFIVLCSAKSDRFIGLLQMASYVGCMLAVYGIGREVSLTRCAGLLAGLLSGILIESLMESNTPQNDLIISFHFGIACYFVITYLRTRGGYRIFFALLSLAIAFGIKGSALALGPSFGILLCVVLVNIYKANLTVKREIYVLLYSSIIGITLFCLPAGYMENWLKFGSIIPQPEKFGIQSLADPKIVVLEGLKNSARYAFDFIKVDGLPDRLTRRLVQPGKDAVVLALKKRGLDLVDDSHSLSAFDVKRKAKAHEDESFWGVAGFLIIWPTVLWVLFRNLWLRKVDIPWALSLASVAYYLCLSFSGAYDIYRGRFFLSAAIMATPLVACVSWVDRALMRAMFVIVLVIACISSLSAVMLRQNCSLISYTMNGVRYPSILTQDRISQLCRSDSKMTETFRKINDQVSVDASIAVALNGNSYEYPLFGARFSRKLYPINSFRGTIFQIPSDVSWLIYSRELIPWAASDIDVGNDWVLRRIH